jgi:hypothetical protein
VGFPVFSRTDDPPVALTPEEQANLEAQAEAIRQHEQMYVLEPRGIRFRFEPIPGVDTNSYLAFIQRYNVWMLATALAEFVALGTGESSGSRALGGNKIDLFLKSLTGFQDRITETISRQAIQQLCRYNGWRSGQNGVTDYPRVSLPAVKEYDLGKLGSFVQILANIGAFHAAPEDEEYFRAIGDLHDADIEEIRKMHAAIVELAETPETDDEGESEDEDVDGVEMEGEDEGEIEYVNGRDE